MEHEHVGVQEAGGVSLGASAACVAAIVLFQFLVSARPAAASGASPATAQRGDLHLQRRLQHALTGAMIYVASGFFGRAAGATVLLLFALLFLLVHEARRRSARVDALYVACFRGILREHEISRAALPGAYYFLLGSGAALALFPPRIARLSVLYLSVGDPTAALVGSLFGRTKLTTLIGALGGDKSLEGSLGCGFVAAAATFLALHFERDFYFFDRDPTSISSDAVTIAMFGGLSGAAAEMLDVGGWDDNLTLPLLAGVFLQLTVGQLL